MNARPGPRVRSGHPANAAPDASEVATVQFQALFSIRDADAVQLDGILHDGSGPGRAATITGARPNSGVLAVVIPGTLDAWADGLAVLEVTEGPGWLELSDGDTRLSLRPVDAHHT